MVHGLMDMIAKTERKSFLLVGRSKVSMSCINIQSYDCPPCCSKDKKIGADFFHSLTLYLIEMPFNAFCKQSRPRSGSSCKSCLVWVCSVCLWKYDRSDPTLVDLTSNFFVQSTNMKS